MRVKSGAGQALGRPGLETTAPVTKHNGPDDSRRPLEPRIRGDQRKTPGPILQATAGQGHSPVFNRILMRREPGAGRTGSQCSPRLLPGRPDLPGRPAPADPAPAAPRPLVKDFSGRSNTSGGRYRGGYGSLRTSVLPVPVAANGPAGDPGQHRQRRAETSHPAE